MRKRKVRIVYLGGDCPWEPQAWYCLLGWWTVGDASFRNYDAAKLVLRTRGYETKHLIEPSI